MNANDFKNRLVELLSSDENDPGNRTDGRRERTAGSGIKRH